MSFNGVRLFRYALLGESIVNAVAFVPMLFSPESVAKFIFRGPNEITQGTKSLIQWCGCIVIALTVPLVLSYPNPTQGGDEQTVAWRRLTYMILGAGEAALGTTLAAQYLMGDSGLTDGFLIGGVASMGVFLAMRAFFLYARPSWMESQVNARKAK